MKKFNDKSISISIPVSTIAQKFVDALNPEMEELKRFKLVESILAPLVEADDTFGITHLYAGLFDLDIFAPAFKETDDLECTDTHYTYCENHAAKINPDDPDEKAIVTMGRERLPIGDCKLIGFDTYKRSRRYEIKFQEMDKEGVVFETTEWVTEGSLKLKE